MKCDEVAQRINFQDKNSERFFLPPAVFFFLHNNCYFKKSLRAYFSRMKYINKSQRQYRLR